MKTTLHVPSALVDSATGFRCLSANWTGAVRSAVGRSFSQISFVCFYAKHFQLDELWSAAAAGGEDGGGFIFSTSDLISREKKLTITTYS